MYMKYKIMYNLPHIMEIKIVGGPLLYVFLFVTLHVKYIFCSFSLILSLFLLIELWFRYFLFFSLCTDPPPPPHVFFFFLL
jgi:hypothetical protein